MPNRIWADKPSMEQLTTILDRLGLASALADGMLKENGGRLAASRQQSTEDIESIRRDVTSIARALQDARASLNTLRPFERHPLA